MIDRKLFDDQIKKDHNITYLSGSDEAGRGCLAGPLVVASVILKPDYFNPLIKDSKQLNPKTRQILFDEIIKNCLDYQIIVISSEQVDKLNPLQASLLGFKTTINNLKITPQLSLIDGNQNIKLENIKTLPIIKGDDLSFSIACSSILAKVTRDKILDEYDQIYPNYGFKSHKGYCTKQHLLAIKKYGILDIHRKSYKPIKKISKETS
ncbi:ribonuclease HII [Mycoplasma feriruminatoris]|uniref:Ribonuclease HII n=1 Tax=Mycoplasma feriruminatoris TaxID=1179777 RepID=A0AAX3TFA8_9MOLU|nr:ribonuclease HII [Mycoplasma feriruminatoris]UKS54186.1 ribonuclease HII family protein [Mycoplasma feriruminatoris]WFQ92729.1 Ribonuclease HII [Mycoplasma feriruminatoris]WFQ93574.1 ribonuclease H II [Mycoplasma feriruminatoris]WFQ96064.1 ribonuclease H II [Mycoplasma feriruminatoris]VZK65359.1 Ribonuclease HII [Mycoplasma feriruminatoris]